MQAQSEFLEVILKRHLLVLDGCRLADLVGSVHCQFSLEDSQHVFGSVVCHSVGTVHHLLHHFPVDKHVVHGLLEVLQVVAHDLEVGIIGVAEHVGHFVEAAHNGLVILEGFHISAYKLHLESHTLDVHGCIVLKVPSARLLAALWRYSLAPSSLFFFNASLAIFIYFSLSFLDLADSLAIRLEDIFISMRVSYMVGFFFGGQLPISDSTIILYHKLPSPYLYITLAQPFLIILFCIASSFADISIALSGNYDEPAIALFICKDFMDYDWIELNDGKLKFKMDRFSQNTFGKRFNRLSHEYMLITVASFGGPIAITSDKTKILAIREDDPSIQNICIFSNEGDIAQRIRLADPMKNVIVCLQFLKDEMLFVLFQKGDIWLINPHTAEVKQSKVIGMLESELLVKGKVFDNGFVVETTFKRFLFARNVSQPTLIEFKNTEAELRDTDNKQLRYWRVFSPKSIISEKVELHICHPNAGIIQVIEDDSKRIFYNQDRGGHIAESKLPHLKGVKFLSGLSPNNKYIAYFAAEPLYKDTISEMVPQKKKKGEREPPRIPYAFAYRIIFGPSISSDSLEFSKFKLIELPFIREGNHVDLNQQPIDIRWCGTRAIVIQFQNQELYMCSTSGSIVKIEKERGEKQKWSFLKDQIDGCRVLTKKDNKILRQIPLAYSCVFGSFSEDPGALLRSAYMAFQDEEPLQDDQIRKDKKALTQGVDECLASARFDITTDSASQLMRSATYGKAFLPPNTVNNNQIYETSKILRIVHHLRQRLLRFITFEQVRGMSDDQLLKILLRYQEHYLAFEIYNFLKKDQNFRIKIFTDWACCKVQNYEESEDQICESIRRKLENEKGISFTEIAHRSIQIGRSELAMKLLEFEPSLAKKVPLLLWIGNRQNLETCYKFYKKSIEEALKSRDLNLLYLAIKRVIASEKLSEYEIMELFSGNIEGVYALINYYRMFDRVALLKYFDYLQLAEVRILELIKIGLSSKKYEDMQKLLFSAGESLNTYNSSLQNEWRKSTFQKLYANFNQFVQHNSNIKVVNEKVKPLSLGRQLEIFMEKGNGAAVDDFKREYNVNDKKIILTRIKVLIDSKKFDDLLIFMEKRQKDFKIPAELIADLLLQKGETTWAMKMMARMPSKKKDEQYLLLQRIGRYKEAIDLAADRKDVDALEDIAATLLEPTLIGYCNEKLSLLRRK